MFGNENNGNNQNGSTGSNYISIEQLYNNKYGTMTYGVLGNTKMMYIKIAPIFPSYVGVEKIEKGTKIYDYENEIFFSLSSTEVAKLYHAIKLMEKDELENFTFTHNDKQFLVSDCGKTLGMYDGKKEVWFQFNEDEDFIGMSFDYENFVASLLAFKAYIPMKPKASGGNRRPNSNSGGFNKPNGQSGFGGNQQSSGGQPSGNTFGAGQQTQAKTGLFK